MGQQPKPKNYKYKNLRRKHREMLHNIGFGNDFLDTTPKAQKTVKNR